VGYLLALFGLRHLAAISFDAGTASKIMAPFYGMPFVLAWIYFIWLPLGSFLFRHSMWNDSKTAKIAHWMEFHRKKIPEFLDRIDQKFCPIISDGSR
jgi:hypothetical protein